MNIKSKITSVARKLGGDEKKVSRPNAHQRLDSREKGELPQAALYTVAECAARLGLSKAALHKRLQRDMSPIPPIRLSKGAIRFSRAAVEEFVKGNTGYA
jgi:predicted DNA-binding transcriptional regulator AlpA